MENKTEYLFTSEVVSPGHPDKCADIIADTIVDKLIIGDSKSRVASEVFVAGKHVVIGGEVTSSTNLSEQDLEEWEDSALLSQEITFFERTHKAYSRRRMVRFLF